MVLVWFEMALGSYLSGKPCYLLALFFKKLHINYFFSPGSPSRPGDWSNPQPWANVTHSEPTYSHGPYQLYNIDVDPEERHDMINSTDVDPQIIENLKQMYEKEKEVAVYPFNLGPAGHPNAQGVWEPWL